ncbi:MATE family efflux transporter DinF [Corallincola luteus]|uniref:MATE family efflux transporter DinF n=1 Tax=Corallincola luteus TaxID=1775177 RepID=A0ABY2AID7_9GAMM|nr:MATE family efflux transporter DinF [Corallincola luteus]TCI01416.1 MATE family efflux transporter DinF [Corallincola luteus]
MVHPLALRAGHRRVLALALPMVASNISVPLLGLVDTFVIGHMDASYYLGGVAMGAMLISLLFWLLGFLRMSTTGLVAQAHGAKDYSLSLQRLGQAAILALTLAFTLLILQLPIKQLALPVAGGSEQVTHYAGVYFDIRIWSAPAALLNLVLLGWFLGMQDAKAPMWVLLLTNLVNIVFDILFVPVLQWGVAGAAAASVLADYAGLLLALWLFQRKLRRLSVPLPWQGVMDWPMIKGLLALNRDIFIRALMLQLCFAFITLQGARLGDEIIAGNAVLLNFLMLASYGLDGFAYAAEALFGRALGQQRRASAIWVLWISGFWSLMLGLGFALVFWLGGEQIIARLTDITAVRETALLYLPYLIVLPIVACWCFWLDGIFIGATLGKAMRNSMLLSTLGVFFPTWWLLQGAGNHALWSAMLLFMAARGVTLAVMLLKGWRSQRVPFSWAPR